MTSAHPAHQHAEAPIRFDQESWEERYGSRPALWSDDPNPQLLAEAAGLTPGHALDVGCGEGADSRWLARRGWRVTGVDFARTALDRAADRATAAGLAGSITWRQADVTTEVPGGPYDLVTAQYFHLPPEPRRAVFARLASAVAPGGTLLIVGHDFADVASGIGRPAMPEMFFTAQELAGELPAAEWEIEVADSRPRTATDAEGQEFDIRDVVLRARRRT